MKMKFALLAAVATVLTAVPAVPAQADGVSGNGTSGSISDYKGFDSESQAQLSPSEAKGEAAKFARAKAGLPMRDPKQGSGPVYVCPISDPCGPPPWAYSLGGRQQAQRNAVWCGPAAVSEALAHQGVTLTQENAVTQLKTDSTGTAWYGPIVATTPHTGYPVADVLNNRLASQGVKYYSIAVGSPTSTGHLTPSPSPSTA